MLTSWLVHKKHTRETPFCMRKMSGATDWLTTIGDMMTKRSMPMEPPWKIVPLSRQIIISTLRRPTLSALATSPCQVKMWLWAAKTRYLIGDFPLQVENSLDNSCMLFQSYGALEAAPLLRGFESTCHDLDLFKKYEFNGDLRAFSFATRSWWSDANGDWYRALSA